MRTDIQYHPIDDDQLLSMVIKALRMPLMIMVVFIHTYSHEIPLLGITDVNSMPVYGTVSHICSHVVTVAAVPLFFLFSGFLFFYHTEFNGAIYVSKLRRRFSSLLVPYLFWNLFTLAAYWTIAAIPSIASHFTGIGVEFSISYFLQSLWAIETPNPEFYIYPISMQFWFIRDLIVLVILTPIIYFAVRKLKILAVIIPLALFLINYQIPVIGARGLSTTGIAFFTLGAWFSINRIDFVKLFSRVSIASIIIYPVLLAIYIAYPGELGVISSVNALALFEIVFFVNITAIIARHCKTGSGDFLARASFFLFAIHTPWLLSQVQKVMFITIHPQSDAMLIAVYFATVILVVIIAVALYAALRRIFPRFTAIVTGSR